MKVVEHQFETKSRAKRDSAAESFSRSLLSGVAGSSPGLRKQTAVAAETRSLCRKSGHNEQWVLEVRRCLQVGLVYWSRGDGIGAQGVVTEAQSKRQGEPLLYGK